MTQTVEFKPFIVRQIELRPLASQGHLVPYEGVIAPPAQKSFVRRNVLFMATFVVPLLCSFIYLFFIAADRYVSEARFIVRSSSASAMDGIASLVSTQGLSRANDETFAVNEYLTSRDAAELLLKNNDLTAIMARPEADMFTRFPNFFTRDNKDKLYKHYKNLVWADLEGSTGISTIQVTAYRPEDAKALSTALLGYAEQLINRLNERSYRDTLKYAGVIVEDAKRDFGVIERRLVQWRNESGSIDPGKEAIAGLEAIGKMTVELTKIEASLAETISLTPGSPGIPAMREKANSFHREIDNLRKTIVGNSNSAAEKLGVYEQFVVERDIAGKRIGAAELNLMKARQEAERQHLYLQTIVEPNQPDQYTYPRRYLYMLGLIGLFGIVYLIIRTVTDIAMEHSA